MSDKIAWGGRVVAVQPRIRLLRSFDERSHVYLGYALRMDGEIGSDVRQFLVGIGKIAHQKWRFQAGMRASGECANVADLRLESVEFYKVSRLRTEQAIELRGASNLRTEREVEHPGSPPPPWLGIPPDLGVYRARGHRRLDARTYERSCTACIWGCRMAVEIIVDHWNPDERRYRFETFCYGPLSCGLHRSGHTRKVPGRHGMTYEEEDWVDADATSHRGPDE